MLFASLLEMKKASNKLKILLLTIGVLLFFVMDLLTGSFWISPSKLFSLVDTEYTVLWEYRFPRAITAIIAGAGLGLSGLLMQTMFRNPLAGPYVLGISSGASLGVALVVISGVLLPSAFAYYLTSGISIAAAAALGAGMVLLLIWLVSQKVGNQFTILIFGLMIGHVFGALQSALQFFGESVQIKEFVIWGMGNYSNVIGINLWIMASLVTIGAVVGFFMAPQLDLFLLGDRYAESMGVGLKKLRIALILLAGITAGVITAFCGPIAFLGLAIPHLARFYFRDSGHALLIPGTFIMGALLSVFCDIFSQLPIAGTAVPINIITSLVGGPIVILVIFKYGKYGENES